MFGVGRHDLWDLALVGHREFYSGVFAKTIADYLLALIGRVEANPRLRNPTSPKPSISMAAAAPTINIHGGIHGGTVTFAQTASGNVAQTIAQPELRDDIRRLLEELEAAIRDVHAPEVELDAALESVEELLNEVSRPKPLAMRLLKGWGAIQAFGAAESAWQGWERVQRIASDLGPRIHDFIQALTSASR